MYRDTLDIHLAAMDDDREEIINEPKKVYNEGFFTRYVQPCLAELIGTMIFVFIGTMSVYTFASSKANPPFVGPAGIIPLAHGFTIALLVGMFGPISGGHFNPAVSLGVCLAGHITPLLTGLYVISQLTGGILGAAITLGSFPDKDYYNMSGAHTLNTASGVTIGNGIVLEAGLTFVLVLCILLTACDTKTKSVLAPILIGFAIAVDISAGLNVTGGSMNPARSFGPAVINSAYGNKYWKYHYVYWTGPVIGSGIAAGFYRFAFGHTDKRLLFKED